MDAILLNLCRNIVSVLIVENPLFCGRVCHRCHGKFLIEPGEVPCYLTFIDEQCIICAPPCLASGSRSCNVFSRLIQRLDLALLLSAVSLKRDHASAFTNPRDG